MSADKIGTPVNDVDYVQLERLALEVNWRVDELVAETLPDLFTEDSQIATFGEPAVGHDALRAWGKMMDAERPLGNLRHVLSDFRFVTDGEDRAKGSFHVTAYVAGAPDETVPFMMGVGSDQYVRHADGWKVVSRAVRPHVMRSPPAAN
jgi:hypothetical protein